MKDHYGSPVAGLLSQVNLRKRILLSKIFFLVWLILQRDQKKKETENNSWIIRERLCIIQSLIIILGCIPLCR